MIKDNTLNQIIFFFFIILMSSCSQTIYAPNDNIMVQLKDKNEINIAGTSIQALQYDRRENESPHKMKINTVQAGYSPIKHLAFAGSFFDYKKSFTTEYKPYSNKKSIAEKGKIWNAAIGTYCFLNFPSNENSGILIDLYAGYGGGEVNHTFFDSNQSSFEFSQSFIQVGLYYKSPFLGFGANVKKTYNNFPGTKVFHGDIGNDFRNIQTLMLYDLYNPWHLNVRFEAGLKYGKMYINMNQITELRSERSYNIDNIAIGLQISVHEVIEGIKKS